MTSFNFGTIARIAGAPLVTLISLFALVASVAVPSAAFADINAPSGSGVTIYVNASATGTPDGSVANPYPTIQAAVAVAAAGDTIDVYPGTYSGDITPTVNNLTINGINGIPTLNLGSGYGFNLDNPPTNVTGFKLTEFTINASPSTTYAFKAYHADGLDLEDDDFEGGAGNTGGGIDINSTSNVTLNNVTANGFHKNGFAVTAAYTSTDTPSSNITFDGITSTNNGWTGISFYTTGNGGGAGNITGVDFVDSSTISGNGLGVFAEGDTDANLASGNVPAYTITSPNSTSLDLSNVAFSNNTTYDVDNYQTDPVIAPGATEAPAVFTAPTAPDAPTDLTAMFQYDSSNLADNSVINYTAKPGNNNLELEWTAPSGTVTGYHILTTYPDGTTNLGYQGPNTNAWLVPNGFGAHGDGAYTFQVQAVNAVGDSASSTPFVINYDTTAPTITSITPADGSVIGGTKTFTVDATDANPSYIYVELNQNGNWITDNTKNGTEGATESTLTYDTTTLADGTYTIKVDAVDKAGNTTEKDYSFIVDNTPPVITSFTPTPDSTISGTTTFTADDSDTNPSYMYVELNQNGDWITDDTKSGTSPSATEASVTYDTTKLTNGTYTIKVDAVDKAGNTTEKDYNFTVYNAPAVVTPVQLPAPTDLTPVDGSTTSDVNFTQTWMPVAGAAKYDYQVTTSYDGTPADFVSMGEDFSDGSNYIVTPTLITRENTNAPLQTYYWRVRAIDASGNPGVWSTVNEVTVDSTPVVTPAAPTPSVTTEAATNPTTSDATLNGENGDSAASGSSFWVSTSPFVTTSTNLPSGVYSTLDLGAVATDTPYSASLSSLATAAYPSAMPAVTPNTIYYYVAWVNVDGTWYPGTEQSFTTSAAVTASETLTTTTNPATNVTDTDATLNGVTPDATADGESFWVSQTPGIDTSDPNTIPSGVYSTPVLPGVASSTPFQDQLSIVTTNGITTGGVPGNMPAITASSTYYYVAWAHINGTWYPGTEQSVTVGSSDSSSDTTPTPITVQPMTISIQENASSTPITLQVTTPGISGDIAYAITTQPTHGTLSAISNDVVDYTPTTGFSGGDSFAYNAQGGTPSTVTINVVETTPVNQAPVTSDVTASSTDDAPVEITLTGTDANGDTLTYATTSSPTNGTLSAISGNTVTYTPTANYSGTDSFTFVANDGQATSTPSTATITVTAATTTPVVTSDVITNQVFNQGVSGSSSGGSSSSSSSSSGSSGSVDDGQVLGASAYNFTKNLTVGSRGEDVTQLQTILIADGYMTGTPTGYFGLLTKAAVKEYQAARNISPVSGFVGPITRAALNAGTTPTAADEAASMSSTTTTTSTSSSIAAEIAALEAQLQAALGTSSTTSATTTATTTSSI